MNDMRRTLLWVVFTMSLVLLWDGWNKHTGQPSLFGPTMVPAAASSPAALPAASGVLPSATTSPGAVPVPPGAAACRDHAGHDRRRPPPRR